MDDLTVHSDYLIEIPWIAFLLYWIVSALKTKRTVHREPLGWRFGIMLVEAFGFALFFGKARNLPVLRRPVLRPSEGLAIAGIVLTWTGIAVAIWARRHLGEYWSGRITLKEDHKLIRTGPYAYFRHPIYSGIDLAAIGSGLAINQWRCVVGLAIIIFGFCVKAWREERLLRSQFGEEFEAHRRATGFLLPKVLGRPSRT
ncbi:MAG TPA: isoprenylcysteine carboxylmethyltransferase family protein [Terriglobales bacterium]|nr:isoprenylcysteine carboxylmethyltransferase family protein [Terriglobales bacterium]